MSIHEEAHENVHEQHESEKREGKADQACDLKRQSAEAGHHVHAVLQKTIQVVAGAPQLARFVPDANASEPVGGPGEQGVDEYPRPLIAEESVAQAGAK